MERWYNWRRREFFSITNKYIYFGNFKNFKFNGEGKIIYNSENENKENIIPILYEGNFENGYKEGKGKLLFNDLSYYEGNFHLDNYNVIINF